MAVFQFECIDGHTCGNPVRLVTKGNPPLKRRTIAEKRIEFMKEYDWIRTGLMFEPRGHDMMSGSFLFPPSDPENDVAILFIETSGCLPMCGHGTIGTITFALEKGLIKPKTEGLLKVEVPAGQIEITYVKKSNKVSEVSITNVPSFLYRRGIEVISDHLGKLVLDISYGGNFYGIIEKQANFKGLEHYESLELIMFSREIRKKVNAQMDIVHPMDDRIHGLSHILWAEAPGEGSQYHRNAVFYGDKAIDRSPCGTGTSARMAQLFARNELELEQDFIHESIIGSQFKGRILGEESIGEFKGILPRISGWARVTGENKITIDQEDPFWRGFQVK